MSMLNFIDLQWEILFSFAVLEEKQKVRPGYKTAPVVPIDVRSLPQGHFRGRGLADTEASTMTLSNPRAWTHVSQ